MSDLRVATVSDLAGTGPTDLTGQWASRARLSYNQQTPIISSSENVTSVTDVEAGKFTINFNSNFSDATYSGLSDVAKSDSGDDGNMSSQCNGALSALHTTSQEFVRSAFNTGGATIDSPLAAYAAFGDLA